mmetsp:Transcript_25544/g.46202  ORF Transcript_25544/g.46202 Transcript_25544/m.46202 type:complete len:311 (+) Transcript_25544:119-1051(+)
MSSNDEEVAASPLIEDDENDKQPLNWNNYLNAVAYIFNITLVYGVGNGGWLGTPTNGELSDKYQTLVTPKSTAFTIWAVIYLAQAAFAVLQFLPRFRAHAMVQDGLSYWYAVAVAMQIGWTFAFAFEVIPLSLIFMLLIWISLMTILYRQYYTKSDGSFLEFWVLRFPFAVHAGWITAASALNVNVQVVSMDTPADVQLAVAIVSLAVLHAISVWVVFYIPRPNWTIACVLSWAFGWIYNELGEPLELITNSFSADTINGVRYAAISVVCVIGIQMVVRLGLLLVPSWNPYRKDASRSVSLVESGAEFKV